MIQNFRNKDIPACSLTAHRGLMSCSSSPNSSSATAASGVDRFPYLKNEKMIQVCSKLHASCLLMSITRSMSNSISDASLDKQHQKELQSNFQIWLKETDLPDNCRSIHKYKEINKKQNQNNTWSSLNCSFLRLNSLQKISGYISSMHHQRRNQTC